MQEDPRGDWENQFFTADTLRQKLIFESEKSICPNFENIHFHAKITFLARKFKLLTLHGFNKRPTFDM